LDVHPTVVLLFLGEFEVSAFKIFLDTSLWGRGFQEVPTAARVAWTGPNDTTEMNKGLQVRLFALTWTNPHPEKEIAALDFISTGTLCDPFLVAATLEQDR
jgi:hypothetical protein